MLRATHRRYQVGSELINTFALKVVLVNSEIVDGFIWIFYTVFRKTIKR
jgi:hypothetical protein